jgi:hypothetical protein
MAAKTRHPFVLCRRTFPPTLYNRSEGSHEENFHRRYLKEEKVEAVLRIVEDKLIYSRMIFISTGKNNVVWVSEI